VQLRASRGSELSVDQIHEAADRGTSSSGQSLPHRSSLESAFGTSLASVQVHSDSLAAQASQAMGAEAFTIGEHIGLASPSPSLGLLAHEVAHVVQQRAGAGPASGVGQVGDSFETEAHSAAEAVTRGQPTGFAARYPGSASPSHPVQRRTVQRYESGEHAIIGVGPQYPFMEKLDILELPNHAKAHPGELVALAGDLYVSIDQIGRLPREETMALIGFTRLEALWFQAGRMKGGSLKNPTAPSPGTPDEVMPPASAELETYQAVAPNSEVWDQKPNEIDKSLRKWREEIFNAFKSFFSIFNLKVSENEKPEGNLLGIKATLGRRRFRGFNDPAFDIGRIAYARNDRPDQVTYDPAGFLGEYGDLAANNVAHFSPENYRTWKMHHDSSFELYRAALGEKDGEKQEQQKRRALAEDMVGLHYLTDRFSAGHTFNKEALMRYSTDMILKRQKHVDKGAPTHKMLNDSLFQALQVAFEKKEVRKEWEKAVKRAADEKLISPPEVTVLNAVTSFLIRKLFPPLSVSQQVVGVLMGMPWRDLNPQTDSSPEAQSFGQASKPSGSGQYQLGVGNLAALNVHDVLNSVGFKQAYTHTSDSPFEMRGDDHLTDATLARAHAAVRASQNQIEEQASRGKTKLDSTDYEVMQGYIPYKGRINVDALKNFFGKSGYYPNARYNSDLMKDLMDYAAQTEIPLNIDTASGGGQGAGAISAELQLLTQKIMDVLFLAPLDAKGKKEDPSKTGLNVTMLIPFLMKRLYDMVGMSYIAAGAADLTPEALALYAPRAPGPNGAVLPRMADDFHWSANEINFRLNVTDCEPGEYELGAALWEKVGEYDTAPTGISVNKGADVHTSRLRIFKTKDYLQNVYEPDQQAFPPNPNPTPASTAPNVPLPNLPQDQRMVTPVKPGPLKVRVPDGPQNPKLIRVSYPLRDYMLARKHAKLLYLRIYADPAGTMLIGRSETRHGKPGER
jgi:hypothetical protein